MTGTQADVVLAALRRHYYPNSDNRPGIFAPEIEAPEGGRRADLIWVPTSIAGGVRDMEFHGHEIKVSRPDVLTELRDPTKADPWSRFCTRWWLVVADPALIDGLDIPETWGVMTPPVRRGGKTMRVLRPAPRLTPDDPAPAWAKLARWQHYAHRDAVYSHNLELGRVRDDLRRANAELERAQANGGAVPDWRAERVNRILTLLDEGRHAHQEPYMSMVLSEATVAAALLNLNAAQVLSKRVMREARDALRRLRELRELKALEALDQQLAALETVTKEAAEDAATITAVAS